MERNTSRIKAYWGLAARGTTSLARENAEFSVFDFEQLLEATNNFSEENKLGQGGFGDVYKVNLLKADMPSSRFFCSVILSIPCLCGLIGVIIRPTSS